MVETNTTPSPDSNDTVINKCIRQFENNLVGKVLLLFINILNCIKLFLYSIGADRADTDEFPHQALLGYGRLGDNDWMCGGSLVSPDFVLTGKLTYFLKYDYLNYNIFTTTAAHCLTTKHAIVKAVKLGMETRLQNDENTLIYGLKQTFIHPSFRGSSVNDIALIQLDKTVKINERIFPICLPTKQHDDYIAIGTGFGRVGTNDPQPNNLLKVELEKFEASEIEHLSVYNLKKIVDRSPLLFYGHHSLEKDTCKGDSGMTVTRGVARNFLRGRGLKIKGGFGIFFSKKPCKLKKFSKKRGE